MSLKFAMGRHNGVTVIRLDGELDALSAPAFRDKVRRAVQDNLAHLVVDMANVRYLSSAGLRTLAYARQRLPKDGRLVLVGANELIRRTIHLVGFPYNLELIDRMPTTPVLAGGGYAPDNGDLSVA